MQRMPSSQIVAAKPETPEGIMMSRQEELPFLPVVPLQDMLRRYMDFVEPFLKGQEVEEFRKIVQDFGKPGGDGELLHKLLAERASSNPNWFSEIALGKFLKSRLPLSSTSMAMSLPRKKFPTKKDQLRQAAALTAGALNFKHLIERQLLQPDVSGKTPLDMSQYQRIFSVYRTPSIACDKMEFNTPLEKSGEHVVAIHNGQMFTFNAYDAHGVPHDESRILTQLIRVVEMSPEKDVGVGILTAEDRDVWAKVYATLGQNSQNAASLEAIKMAAVVVCLDGGLADAGPYEVAWPRQVCKGGPNAEYGANRWWDKPVQVIVGEDGGSALLYDHTAFDGTVMARVTNHCYDYAQKAGSFEASKDDAEAAPQKLKFVLGPDTLHDIEKAKSSHARYAGGTERLFYQFSNYGKKFIQSCNMSPDGYTQMAVQLAAFRCIGSPVMVLGAASTRQFLHGRVDSFHASTEESLSFCKIFDSPLSSREEKEQSLRKAVERCKQDAVFAAEGLAVTRMMYSLISIGLEDGIPIHPFFKNRVFWRPHVIASQVNLQCDGTTLDDPPLPDVYMVTYNIRPDSFTFGLSCGKSFPEKNISKFKDALEQAFTDLRECMDRSR
ncbi:carnitine O-acetyltransferase [Ixodes scapularis]